MIRLDQVNKSYYTGSVQVPVLYDIGVHIGEGEFVAIMGPSGSGKSTLLNILGLLDLHDSGTYELGDLVVKDFSERAAARHRNRLIGFVFQSFNLISYKTALENVALPLQLQGVSRRLRLTRAREALAQMGLGDRIGHLPNQLSGGQKQRVAMARALITQPRLLLADEPTGNLDSVTSGQVMQMLRSVNKQGKTIIVVTHDEDVAHRCDRIMRLVDGRIVEDRMLTPA